MEKKNTKKSKPGILLAVVALLEVMLLLTGITYSWIEGSSSLEIRSTSLRVQDRLNSSINIHDYVELNDESSQIDLGTFFEKSTNFMFSPTSSANGRDFYFNYHGDIYRPGTSSDKNVNYISFDYKIKDTAKGTKYWFDGVPKVTLKKDGREISNEAVRLSLTNRNETDASKKTIVFKPGAAAQTQAISSLNGTRQKVVGTQNAVSFADYTYDEGGNNDNNALFELEKNNSVVFNVSLWIESEAEDFDFSELQGATLEVDLKICSSWSKTVKITVADATSNFWFSGDNASIYITDGDANNPWVNRNVYKLTKDGNSNTWTADIPVAITNYRVERRSQNGETLYNYWKAGDRGDETVYTVFYSSGASDENSVGVWGDGEIVEITFTDSTVGNDNNTQWVAGDDIRIYMWATPPGSAIEQRFTLIKDNGASTWKGSVPETYTITKFSRVNNYGEGSVLNTFPAGNRGTKTTYTALGNNVGTWEGIREVTFNYAPVHATSNRIKVFYSYGDYNFETWLYTSNNREFTGYIPVSVTEAGFKRYSNKNSSTSDLTWSKSSLNNNTRYVAYTHENGLWDDSKTGVVISSTSGGRWIVGDGNETFFAIANGQTNKATKIDRFNYGVAVDNLADTVKIERRSSDGGTVYNSWDGSSRSTKEIIKLGSNNWYEWEAYAGSEMIEITINYTEVSAWAWNTGAIVALTDNSTGAMFELKNNETKYVIKSTRTDFRVDRYDPGNLNGTAWNNWQPSGRGTSTTLVLKDENHSDGNNRKKAEWN